MTIKEVAEITGISEDTLRYYEKVGLIKKVKKNKSGIRDYSESEVRRIKFIRCMRKAEVSITVLKKYFELFDNGEDTFKERKELLELQRDMLKEKIDSLTSAYELLNDKVELFYSGKIDEYFKKYGGGNN